MSRTKRFLKKLSLSFVSFTVVLMSLELFLRSRESGPFTFFDRNPYTQGSSSDGHVRHKPNFKGSWDSTWYGIDSRGFRGPERVPTMSDGELRVACLGDSCTFGKGVEETTTWPRVLEALLRGAPEGAAGAPPLVFNMGINGGYSDVYRAVLEENIDELKPQVVLVGFNINDFPNTIRSVDEKVYGGRGLRLAVPQGLRDSLGRLATYRWARALYYETKKERDWAAAEQVAKESADEPVDSTVWEEQRQILETVRDLTEAHGGRMMVFLFPYESQVFLDTYDPTPIRRLGGLCDEIGVPFFDLAGEFRAVARETDPPRQLFIKGDRYHPNGVGYGVVARRVFEELSSRDWLK